MSCLLTTGIAKGCKDNSGGIKRALITNSYNVLTVTPTVGATTDLGIITAIGMSGAGTTGATATFFEFVPNKMSSNWVETIQANMQNGTVGYEQVLTLIFAKNEAAKRNQIKLMGQAELVAIVEDYNGKYWMLGEDNGLELSGGSSTSGTALTDLNGWTINLTGLEHDPAREVDGTIVAGLL